MFSLFEVSVETLPQNEPYKYHVTYEWINAWGEGLVTYIAKGPADAVW